jgi:hypothetical protein
MIPFGQTGNTLPYTQSNERTGAPMNMSAYLSSPNANVFSGLQSQAQKMTQGGGGRRSLTLEEQISLVAQECTAYDEGSNQKANCLDRLRQLTEQNQMVAEAKDAAAKAASPNKDQQSGTGTQGTETPTPSATTTPVPGDELDRLVQQRATARTPQEREVFNRRINEIMAERRRGSQQAADQDRRDELAARQGRVQAQADQQDKDRFSRWLQTKRGMSYMDQKDIDSSFQDPAVRNEYEAWKKASRITAQSAPQPSEAAAMNAYAAQVGRPELAQDTTGRVAMGPTLSPADAQKQVEAARATAAARGEARASDAYRQTEQEVRTARQAMQDAGVSLDMQMRLEQMYKTGQINAVEMRQFIEAAKASSGRTGVPTSAYAVPEGVEPFRNDKARRLAAMLSNGEITREQYEQMMYNEG